MQKYEIFVIRNIYDKIFLKKYLSIKKDVFLYTICTIKKIKKMFN